jgi:hypothetical protein
MSITDRRKLKRLRKYSGRLNGMLEDGNGDIDLFVGDGHGDIMFFENVGSATAPSFATVAPNPFGLARVEAYALPTFGDLDDDGDCDLLVGEGAGTFEYFENTTL